MNIKEYLAQEGYSSVAEWAIDSGYRLSDAGEWLNEHDHVTDVEQYLQELIYEIYE